MLGAIYSPQRQTYTDEQLKTKRTFENGTGEMRLSSQTYSPETGIIILQFETKDSTSPVDRGIDTKRLKWNLYAKKKTSQTTMEIIPIVDNKISVIIRNVPEDFGAYAIDITNKTISSSSIDIDVSNPSEEQEKPSKPKDNNTDNVIQFYVTTQSSQLKTGSLKKVSREEFALSEINEEKDFQTGQIKKLSRSIKQLKTSIEDDESRKSGLLKEAGYLSGDDLETNQKILRRLRVTLKLRIDLLKRLLKILKKSKLRLLAWRKSNGYQRWDF